MKDKKGKTIIIITVIVLILGLSFWYVKNTFLTEVVFTIQENSVELKVGSSFTLNYELNKKINIKWESNDPNIVTIDNGTITAHNIGNTIVKGTVTSGDKTITKTCNISTFLGEKGVNLNDIIIPGEVLYITNSDSYELPIEYSPNNAFINDIEYNVVNPNIVEFNGKIVAKSVGTTNISIVVNKNVTKTISVNVISKQISPVISSKITDVSLEEEEITLKPNENKDIKYTITPSNAFVENVKWSSSDNSIVTVDSGLINAKAPGEAIITLLVNDTILKEIHVKVMVPVTGLSLVSSPKLVMKVGGQETIKTNITPDDATNKKLVYTSSNPSSIKIDEFGGVTALAVGSGTITVKSEDGDYKVDIPYTVNPKLGVVNNAASVWGYTSSRDKTPTRADANFFRSIASSGKGTLSNNTYIYNDGKNTYSYDLSTSKLSVNGHEILMRIYYPQGVDLSKVNTFTFFGGSGELNMGGYFNHLDKNVDEMNSSGIVILVSGKARYNYADGISATGFVKSIVGQTSGVTNAVGGYSLSGNAAGEAFFKGNYNRLIIFNSCVDIALSDTVKNKEITVYSPVGDSFTNQTVNMVNKMTKAGYSNITVVSNNSVITANTYISSNHLIINPGSDMGRGHGYVNISKARIFAYANR